MHRDLKIGDLVEHRVHNAQDWGIGIVKTYRKYHGIYEVLWSDGEVRSHTFALLKQIA